MSTKSILGLGTEMVKDQLEKTEQEQVGLEFEVTARREEQTAELQVKKTWKELTATLWGKYVRRSGPDDKAAGARITWKPKD